MFNLFLCRRHHTLSRCSEDIKEAVVALQSEYVQITARWKKNPGKHKDA